MLTNYIIGFLLKIIAITITDDDDIAEKKICYFLNDSIMYVYFHVEFKIQIKCPVCLKDIFLLLKTK